MDRPYAMESVTLIDAARSWTYNSKRKRDNKWEARTIAAIVRVFPRFTTVPTRQSEKWVDFCWSELLLYKPFRNIQRDIGLDDNIVISNWESLNYNPWHLERRIITNETEDHNDSEDDDDLPNNQNTIEHEWEIISRLHHGQIMDVTEIDMLGRRDIDKQNPWSAEYQGDDYTNIAINFINTMKENGLLIPDDMMSSISFGTLGAKQKKALDIIMSHYNQVDNAMPLYMIIQGTVGTGKSYLIHAIHQTLNNASGSQCSPLLLLAPTGVAAFNIGASTIHSSLRIPIVDFAELEGTRLTSLQEEIQHIKYILIDEMSFIGQNLLQNIDSRLRQAFLEKSNMSFGGRSIILVGDLGQLPPISDKPPYDSNVCAKLLWQEFKTVVTLDKVFRQDGETEDQQRFHQLLTNIRDAHPTIDDWKLLMTRTDASLHPTIKEEFDNNIHLFATNDNVHNHNRKKLYALRRPIARSIASKEGSTNPAGGQNDELDVELLISKDARVMLTSNLWIEAGLVNGALGYIQNIIYKPGCAPPDPPTYVMVEFDNYSGLPFEDASPNLIPISPIQRGRTRQLPLQLAWALTIHKSQGLTLSKATIDRGPRERSGLTFVAISCVKALDGIRISPPFSYDHYEKMKIGK
ncbi:uncharacterized protein LOC131063676 [Cryptomeria japonica]|uniref:uncharacterized protein LOC131063676 n=1 Tax=Cryptomeria japonica TaxID=3369 RepID=UPI0027DA134F|nr:uncharacterized protein LOC131063676 [Cryptomeria japonica]